MRHRFTAMLGLIGAVGLAGCNRPQSDAEVQRAIKDVNVIDESNLSDIMLTVGDPDEAVAYFARSLQQNPERADLKRGLAKSLVRAGKPTEAVTLWADLANATTGPAPRPNWPAFRPPTRPLNGTGWRRWSLTAAKTGKKPTVFMALRSV
jgi:hypothetical protein